MTCCSRIAADRPRGAAQELDSSARARPLLGTTVTIRVAGLPREAADRAIDRGFAAVAKVHRLMSFHEAGSDVSRLNREAARGPVAVDPHTVIVLRQALEIAAASRGVFDPSLGGPLAARGVLPRPVDAPEPDPAASWRDIAVTPEGRVRFARPLWIDLGGIAKGYAVDLAGAAMTLPAQAQAVIEAGGDLRVWGPDPEPVQLAVAVPGAVPVVELHDGAIAGSTSAPGWGAAAPTHLHGTTRRAVGGRSFAAVAAPSCMVADALTKPVLALGARAEPLLRRYGAIAYLYSARRGWRILGGA
jgi:thiamine biosynthesis lipoprotein